MRRFQKSVAGGLLSAVVGVGAALVPALDSLEDSLGLRTLLYVRGRATPPESVAVVSVDEATSAALGLPQRVRDWPRSLHARLVDRLVASGAGPIAFDVGFFDHSADPAEDAALATAFAEARNIVLVQRFEIARAGGRELWQRND